MVCTAFDVLVVVFVITARIHAVALTGFWFGWYGVARNDVVYQMNIFVYYLKNKPILKWLKFFGCLNLSRTTSVTIGINAALSKGHNTCMEATKLFEDKWW